MVFLPKGMGRAGNNMRPNPPDSTTGTYHLVAESSNFDAVLSMCDNNVAGKELACNDDFTGSQPMVSHALSAGPTVAIVIDGFEGGSGDFRFYVTLDS